MGQSFAKTNPELAVAPSRLQDLHPQQLVEATLLNQLHDFLDVLFAGRGLRLCHRACLGCGETKATGITWCFQDGLIRPRVGKRLFLAASAPTEALRGRRTRRLEPSPVFDLERILAELA
jgi:hypothetical protein